MEQEPQKKRQRTPLLLESRTSPAMILTQSEKSIQKSSLSFLLNMKQQSIMIFIYIS